VVSASGLTFPVTVSGLATKRAYTFDVTATNAFGTGPAASKTLQASLVTVAAIHKPVAYGKYAIITGRVTDATTGAAVSGQTITLQVRPKGGASYVLVPRVSARSKADGTFALRYKVTATNHIMVIAAGSGRMTALAAPVSLWVHATSTISLNDRYVSKGQTVRFTGTVRPAKGTVVRLQHRVGARWVLVRSTTVRTSTGRWALTWHATGTGKSYFRVRVLGTNTTVGYSLNRWVVVA
jgi:archaellin